MQKIALITGANKGIGLETVRQLARDHGFTVLIGARDEARGTQAADELKAAGLDAQFLLLDPTDAASVERARAQVEQKFGSLDVLVNNAGKFDKADLVSPEQVPVSALRETFDLNVFAVHRVTQAFWPLLDKSDAARLVNVSSAIGSLALNADFNGPMKDMNLMAYAASKAALNMMTLHFANGKTRLTGPMLFIPAAFKPTSTQAATCRSKKAPNQVSKWWLSGIKGQTAPFPISDNRCPGDWLSKPG